MITNKVNNTMNAKVQNNNNHSDEILITFEEAFETTKGSKASQWIYGLILWLIYNSARGFVYGLPFLGKYPDFEWRSNSHPDWYQCPRADVWNNSGELSGFEYRYNTNSIYTIDNWVTSMNLECVPEYKIGLFGSLYFIGYLLGSATLTRRSDIHLNFIFINCYLQIL